MRNNNLLEKDRWLRAAQDDLEAAKQLHAGGFYPQACFLCQQAGEKALKAFLYGVGIREMLSHSLLRLSRKCRQAAPEWGLPEEAARRLDRFYIPTRYPNGLPEGTPRENFSGVDAESAMEAAKAILAEVRKTS